MAFSNPQLRKLRSKLHPGHVKMRATDDGQVLHYLEGWHVIAEANRIFGFDGWDRETIANSCVWTKQIGARFCAAYVAKVRISVRAGDCTIIREGSGAGESSETSPGQAHDRAFKAAETDATKRALTTFGNRFGLTLYAGAPERPSAKAANGDALREEESGTSKPYNNSSNGLEVSDSLAHTSETDRHIDRQSAGSLAPSASQTPIDLKSAAAPGHSPAQPLSLIRIDKSVLTIPEPRRIRDPEHLRFVAEQPCLICGRHPCEAHHLRYVQPRALGRKSSDSYTVPLCALHHRDLHANGNERAWWVAKGRDPLLTADQLWRDSMKNGVTQGGND